MSDLQLDTDCMVRVGIVRRRRCGGDDWKPPHPEWATVVSRSWPIMFYRQPAKVPDGWCDIILAMADHLTVIGKEPKIIDTFEDYLSGHLATRFTAPESDFEKVKSVINGYERLSGATCRKCGDPGEARRVDVGRQLTLEVLCDEHAGE